MTKIAMYNVSPIEVPYIEDWAKKNDVEIKTTDRPGQGLGSEKNLCLLSHAPSCFSRSHRPLHQRRRGPAGLDQGRLPLGRPALRTRPSPACSC